MHVVESFFNIYCQRLTKLVCQISNFHARFGRFAALSFFRVPDTADES